MHCSQYEPSLRSECQLPLSSNWSLYAIRDEGAPEDPVQTTPVHKDSGLVT